MKVRTENIKMKFICNQDWDEMKPSPNGRFCELCKKEVYDFTQKSNTEINALKSKNQELCGNFRADQIEQDLIPIHLNFTYKPKIWLSVFGTIVGIGFTSLKAQRPSVDKNPYVQTDNAKIKNDSITVDSIAEEPIAEIEEYKAARPNKPFMSVGDSRFYWSKKFPFIKRRKIAFRGKF